MKRSLVGSFAAVVSASLWIAGMPQSAHAHGLHAHVHVTGWAVENLPPGELHDIFDDPDVFHAALSGAMFPDTGYATDDPGARDYGESAHWEPFIEPFVQHVRSTYGPTYDSKEEKMLVAFLLGCASHGLQDELFDSTFLFEIEEHDGSGQDITDPALDGFMILDGYFRLLPGDFFPVDEVLPVYGTNNPFITRALITENIRIVREAYVNDGLGARIAMGNGRRYRRYIPWASDNYLDPGVAGSLAAEIKPTARHMQALWDRLHDRFDETNLVVHTWPEAPRRLRSGDHNTVASWITLVLGKGIQEGSATASLVDSTGAPQPFRLRYTRWGGTSRIVRFQPTADLLPGGIYTATLEAGATLVDGSTTTRAHPLQFRVDCAGGADCEPVVITDDPTIALPALTATPTATESPTQTASATSEPTQTASATSEPTQTASITSEPTHTTTVSPTVTSTPTHSLTATTTPSPSRSPTVSPTASPTANATATTTATASASASSTVTNSPTRTATVPPTVTPNDDDDGSCRMATNASASPAGVLYLLLGAGVLMARRQRQR